jgi:pimeloyl-ACP methyl ester carboxylesterase
LYITDNRLVIKSIKNEVESNMEDVLNLSTSSDRIPINTHHNNYSSMNISSDLSRADRHDTLGINDDSIMSSHECIDNMLNEVSTTAESKNQRNNKRSLVIICSGNGGSYEVFHRGEYWINYYLNLDCDICIWNYRGYGLSTGRATLKNVKQDADLVFGHMVSVLRYKRVIIHGISIGGIPSCHLAR